MDKLLPCPFCGGEAMFHPHEGDGGVGCHHIECQSCKVMVDFGTTADPDNADITIGELQRRIAPFWNRRADSAPVVRK